MTAYVIPQGKQYYESSAGQPAVGYKVATFDAGTTNPRTTWADAAQTTPNANPIILDARGEASIFWSGVYKVQFQDSTGAVIWTQDNVSGTSNNFPSSLLPAVTNTVDLGSASFAWRNLYLGPNGIPAFDTTSGYIGYIPRTLSEQNAAVTPISFAYQPGDFRRYGAAADGVTDDSVAMNNAFKTGHTVIGGDASCIYRYNSSISIPAGQSSRFDGRGCTLKPSGTSQIANVNATAVLTTTASSGFSQGSTAISVASVTGLAVGNVIAISASTFPTIWARVLSISVLIIGIDCPIPFTYSGTVNVQGYAIGGTTGMAPVIDFRNANFDGSLTTGGSAASGNCVRFVNAMDCTVEAIGIRNFNITTSFTVLVQIFLCATASVNSNVSRDNVIKSAGIGSAAFDISDCSQITFNSNKVNGQHFGCDITRGVLAVAVGNVMQGRSCFEAQNATFPWSTRGIKFSSCATAVASGNSIDDYWSPLKSDLGFRHTFTGNSMRNAAFLTGTNSTDAGIECGATSDANVYGYTITGNVFENMGGLAISINNGVASGNARAVISGNYIRRCQAQAMFLRSNDVDVSDNIIEDWDLANVGGVAIDYLNGANVQANRFFHASDPTKICLATNLTTTFGYAFRDNYSPTANPIFSGTKFIENGGSSSIASGSTTVVVNHGLIRTPTTDEISITPSGTNTNTVALTWVTSINSTSFTFVCNSNPGASGFPFFWRASLKMPFTA